MTRPIKLIIGLGNRGKEYEKTRHNIGFLILEELKKRLRVSSARKVPQGVISQAEWQGIPLLLAHPQTFMNVSGEAVKALTDRFKIGPSENLLVLLDDVDLPLGQIRLRKKGSSGGHRGLQSIIDHLGSTEFSRLRFGISRSADSKLRMEDYVLGEFRAEEKERLKEALPLAVEAGLIWVEKGIAAAMNKYNR